MEILKFSLGVRFDTLKDSVAAEDVSAILSELTRAVPAEEAEGLDIYGGIAPIDARDSRGVYTVVFMNGGIKTMRRLYARLDSDARISAYLESRVPYTQNNVIRNYRDMEYLGSVSKHGVITGGSRSGLVFRGAPGKIVKNKQAKTILIAPNSFKGTIPANTAVKRLRLALRKLYPDAVTLSVPVADGGDGTLDAVEASLLSNRRTVGVTGPYGEKINADYLITGGGAVIESALASGLAIAGDRELDPLIATSFGTGELIARAAHEGASKIFVCLGGSATNDCGMGIARALGCRFLNENGEEVTSARDMCDIASMDASGLDKCLIGKQITVMCDVDNPLTGPHGATYTFGPQKGADGETLELLERGMINMARLLDAHAGYKVSETEGAGAAGGMGAMLMALLGARRLSGAKAVLDISCFDELLENAALVITGEGCIDATTLSGKAVGEVLERANRAKVPAAIIAGSLGEGSEAVLEKAALYELTESEEDALHHFDMAADRLAKRIKELGLL
jgi:glycerate kinase